MTRDKDTKNKKVKRKSRRAPYADLGLMLAVSVLICMFVKCMIFGFTWGSIVWLAVTVAYLFLSARYPSRSRVVKVATTLYLVLSVMAVVAVMLFDKNARPKMHAFEGVAGDTIVDKEARKQEKETPVYVPVVVDTMQVDTISASADDTEGDEIPEEGMAPADSISSTPI